MAIVPIVTTILSYLTFIADAFLVVALFLGVFAYISGHRKKLLKHRVTGWIGTHGFTGAFVVAVVATVGSLFYSEIAQYEPCKLCWIQRIFMYPQVILLGAFLDKKDKTPIIRPALILAGLGAMTALYHYVLQVSPSGAFVPCSTVGISVSCTTREFTNLGYITIPMMAFTAFMLIIGLLWLYRKAVVKK